MGKKKYKNLEDLPRILIYLIKIDSSFPPKANRRPVGGRSNCCKVFSSFALSYGGTTHCSPPSSARST